jgi:Domain of unknown function (DUF4203)
MHAEVNMIAGAVLLLVGRKLFWLFVAIAGFYVGFEVARAVFTHQPQWLVWLVAAAAGVIGAVVAMLFQRVAFALGGFYAGGYLALVAAERYLPGAGAGAFIVGGVAGAIAAALLMDWAVVILSCLVGAALVVSSLALRDPVALLAYAALVVIGIAVQRQLLRGQKRTAAPS